MGSETASSFYGRGCFCLDGPREAKWASMWFGTSPSDRAKSDILLSLIDHESTIVKNSIRLSSLTDFPYGEWRTALY